MNVQNRTPQLADYALMSLLALIWGSSFILYKQGLNVLNWQQVAVLRIVVSATVMLPWAISWLRRLPARDRNIILAAGVFGNGLPPFLFALAQTQLESALTGILNALSPIWTLIIGAMFFGLVANRNQIIGLLLGLTGSVLIILFNADGGIGDKVVFGLFVVAATACYGTSTNIIKRYLQNVDPVAITAVALLGIGIPAGVALPFTGFFDAVAQPGGWEAAGYIALLAVSATAFASWIFYILVQRTDALFAAAVAYVIPLVAIVWGVADGERLAVAHVIGLSLILGGVWMTGRKAKAKS